MPASDRGDKLLIGREKFSKTIKSRLEAGNKIITVEGLNGVGKTSAINVAVYRAYKETLNTRVGPFFIPCRTIFQLDEITNPDDFQIKVLLEVAQTIIEKLAVIPPRPGHTKVSNNTSLERFINAPQYNTVQAGLTAYIGASAGFGAGVNDGVGFEKSGLQKAITSWLEEIFPTTTSGAVVCVLDNLELLQTSQRAREVVEALRDTLFSVKGLRWVLCGALGIVNGIASSPRLDGRMYRPLVVEDLDDSFVGDVFDSRKRAFRQDLHSFLPLDRSQFIEIFDIMRGNLRSALSECDEYCNWVADRVEDRDDFYPGMFEEWLEEELEATYLAVRSELRPTALEVFETACQFEVFSPSDCSAFGYKTPSAMRPHIKSLEDVGLLQSSLDETDQRRKTIQVTSKGWKVRAFLDLLEDDV